MKTYPLNTLGRDFVVGDLHGCYDLLMTALGCLNFDGSKDRLFSVGDLIDRGEKSAECLALLDEPWFFAIAGNHEIMFADMLESDDHKLHFLKSGGMWVLDADTSGFDGLQGWHSHWSGRIKALPRALTIELQSGLTVGLVHAECNETDWSRLNENDEDVLWGRFRIRHMIDTKISGISHVFCGHTIVKNPITLGNITYLDTGAFTDGILSIADLSRFDAEHPKQCITSFTADPIK